MVHWYAELILLYSCILTGNYHAKSGTVVWRQLSKILGTGFESLHLIYTSNFPTVQDKIYLMQFILTVKKQMDQRPLFFLLLPKTNDITYVRKTREAAQPNERAI